MILFSTVPVTQTQLKLISLWIHSPAAIRQDTEKNPIFVVSPQARLKDRNILKVKLFCLIVYSVFLLFNGLWHLRSPRLQIEEKALVALFSLCIPGVVLAVLTSLYQNPADFVILLNMILTNERNVLNSTTHDYNKILRYGKFLKCAIRLLALCGSLFIQGFVLLLVIVKPGRYPFLGSIILGS